MAESPLRREAWGAARRRLGLAWFARGLTAGRLVQLPSKPNAVRRGTRPGEGWVSRGLPAASRPVGFHTSNPNAVRRGVRPGEGWAKRGSPAASRPVGFHS